jgi:hypothetical protein
LIARSVSKNSNVMRQLNEILDVEIPMLREGSAGAYLLALLCALASISIRVIIDPFVLGAQFVFFIPGIIIASLVSGFGAGMLCAALCTGSLVFHPASSVFGPS